jgi:chromate transporter
LLSWLGFTLPSALIMFGFAVLTPRLNSPYLEPVLHGLKLVAVAVVAQAVWSMAPKLCPDKARAGIAIVAFAALLFSVQAWMQIGVLVAGAITGLILCRHVRQVEGVQIAFIGKRIAIAAGFTFLILLALLPVWAHFSPDRFAQVLATTYSSGALVFGGGHVVLPLLHDAMVPTHLVSNNQFLAGYGVAQALPGPLFSFGAYLGATAAPTGQAALWAAMATLFIFLPGLLVSVAGVPLWQWLSRHEGAQGAFAGVNAAVVGLLSAALYSPVFTSAVFNGIDLAIAAIGFVFLEKWRAPPLLVVLLLVASTFAMRALGFG